MTYNQIVDVPCAYITKNKQRLKQFGQNVYLTNGSEFEIELHNPSRKTVLSKIKINGEFISGGGIILRPGERVFLERYLDVPQKFKFETYTVDSTNQTMNGIANNGDVEILFYQEQEISLPNINIRNWDNWDPNYVYYGSGTPIVGNNFYTTSLSNMNVSSSYSTHLTSSIRPASLKRDKSIETGRVEKGSSSKQEFSSVSKNFNSWTVSTSVWKILPDSQKPIEKKDLIQRCPKCSSKIKKSSWKFCPECGNEFKQETYEDKLNKLSKEELIELLKNK